jgi:NADPH:quinone reductase
MARVVVATAPGGPEVLAVVDQPVAAPGAGEARVEVRAAGINPIDWKFYSPAMGAHASYPMRLGFEAAGVVSEVGADATGPAGAIAVGDEVIAYSVLGGYADEFVVSASALVPKPAELTWEAAGGLVLAGVTAVHTLVAAKVGAGETLLVHAASGGVGLMAVQVAVARGVRVIGTSSERNHEYLRELGVEPVAYGDGLAERVRALAPEGVDAAIDCVGTDEAVDVSLELVGDRDRIVTIVRSDRALEAGLKLLGNGPGADPGTEIRQAARMELVELVRQGKLEVRARAFAFDDAAQAHREGMAGHVVGKLVLVPEAG